MSESDALNNYPSTSSLHPLQPCDPKGKPLTYNNNKATINGLLFEFGKWCIAKRRFIDLFKVQSYAGIKIASH